jgi:hypothetical protein
MNGCCKSAPNCCDLRCIEHRPASGDFRAQSADERVAGANGIHWRHNEWVDMVR